MALIKCPECNQDVSTFASACPHCGYPLTPESNNGNVCEILGKKYDLTEVLSLVKQGEKIKAIKLARERTGLGLAESSTLVDEIINNNYKIPAQSQIETNSRQSTPSVPKCPICGSTNLMKITAWDRGVAAGLFGGISKTARSQYKCKNCDYMF